ncbi:hypothetical protein CPB86DRAFT_702791 [Serendipita vermifera]|nr:hypothetical protein CPB86DRAFT_702791 [Serendipita vermifera]
MDELAESPLSTQINIQNTQNEGKEDSGDENEMLDWTKLAPKQSKASRSLPKRGEKAFEPIMSGPSAYQNFTLTRARQAMYDALSAPREIQTKRLSQAIWMPQYARAQIIDARGTSFNSLGYTTKRTSSPHKCLELLPEEALYLIERGSMLCWRELSFLYSAAAEEDDDPVKIRGEPMTIQRCFVDMLGVDGVTLEHYQVYSYLKRFGYIVRRAYQPPSTPDYVSYTHPKAKASIFQLFQMRIQAIQGWFSSLLNKDPWSRFNVKFGLLSRSQIHYPSLFRSFRIIMPYSRSYVPRPSKSSPYQVFFHVWKPDTIWNRASLSPPNFEVVVINARTTPVPTIDELVSLYDTLPETRQPQDPKSAIKVSKDVSFNLLSILKSTITWLFRYSAPRKGNPFTFLKEGKKSVVIAVVDAGTTSLYRFNEGCFEDWPMI